MSAILDWLLANIPWLAPTVVLVIIAIWATRHISHWVDKLDQAVRNINSLPCSDHLNTINTHTGEINRHIENIDEHRRRLSAIETRLQRWDEKMIDIALASTRSASKGSPYSLTTFGKFILEKSGGKECVDRNLETMFAAISKLPRSTPYDVERAAFGVVLDSFSSPVTDTVKNFIYNSPSSIDFEGSRQDFTTTDIQAAMAIYLRDLYLRQS